MYFIVSFNKRKTREMEKNRIFDWLLRFIKGGVMGMDFVLPGISGAALAVVFGLYERIVRFIAHITTDFVKNVFFFIPVGCGVLIGIYIVSHPMSFLLENYITPVLWFFVGAILGTMPDLWRKSGEKGRKTLHIGMLAGTFAIATPLFVIMAGSESFGNLQVNTWTAFGAGAMVAFVAFIPGVSSSTFLVMLGLY
jgi:putative membrane protein